MQHVRSLSVINIKQRWAQVRFSVYVTLFSKTQTLRRGGRCFPVCTVVAAGGQQLETPQSTTPSFLLSLIRFKNAFVFICRAGHTFLLLKKRHCDNLTIIGFTQSWAEWVHVTEMLSRLVSVRIFQMVSLLCAQFTNKFSCSPVFAESSIVSAF